MRSEGKIRASSCRTMSTVDFEFYFACLTISLGGGGSRRVVGKQSELVS